MTCCQPSIHSGACRFDNYNLVTYYIFGNGLISSLVGGVIWLVALKVFYNIEWFKAFMITVVVWISATVIEFLLPTVPGSV
jgi:hypothetical protein